MCKSSKLLKLLKPKMHQLLKILAIKVSQNDLKTSKISLKKMIKVSYYGHYHYYGEL